MDMDNAETPPSQPVAPQENTPFSAATQQTKTTATPKSKKKYIFIALASILVCLVVLVITYLAKFNKKPVSQVDQASSTTPFFVENNPLGTWSLYTNRAYFYSIPIPPQYAKLKVDKAEGGSEEYVEYSKGEGNSLSKISILMTSSKTVRDKITSLKEKLKDSDIGEEAVEEKTRYSKVYISNFTAYKIVSEKGGYSISLLIEKDKWMYHFSLESANISDKQILDEVALKIKIFDSEAQFNVENSL